MKICLLSRNFLLQGGIGRVGLEIRNKLMGLGHEVRTISTSKEDLISYFLYTSLEILFRLPRGMDIYHAITPMESIWIPKEKGISVILDIIALTHMGQYGGRLTTGKGIVTFHDIFTMTNPKELGAGISGGLKRWISKNYFKFACEQALKCKYVVVVSEHVKNELLRYFKVDGSKIKVIKSGIRSDLVYLSKKDRKFRLGYIGQLDRRKRVNLLIEAFKVSNLDELVIAGKGLDENMLKRQADGDGRIKFLGFIPDIELVDFYNSLDVFVFPTVIEGYGLPIVEAMACKKPVIVLGDAEIPWEVKSRCIIVDGLSYVLGNRDYLERLFKGVDYDGNYKWAKEHSWDKTVDEYIKLYEEVLKA